MRRFISHFTSRKRPRTPRQPTITHMFPTIHSWKRGELERQEYFTFRDDQWYPIEPNGTPIPPGAETPRSFHLSVLSWNIDFMRPHGNARMAAALNHLRSLVSEKPDHPSVIMLNEMTQSDLGLIKRADWVRAGYNITDASTDHWESPSYGTCMLIPHSLPIKSVSRLHYEITSMQRDALFVDVALPDTLTLRLCTSHLESLRANPPKRPAQLAAAARHLRSGTHAGVLAGDLNAIEEFDQTLHVVNGLRDAYLESGGVEGEEEGMTWGHMAGRAERERFGLSRMDKILFCGRVRLVGFGRFGMDVVVEDGMAGKQLMEGYGLEKPWVTDHLGVGAEFCVEVPDEVVREEGETQSQEAGSQGPA